MIHAFVRASRAVCISSVGILALTSFCMGLAVAADEPSVATPPAEIDTAPLPDAAPEDGSTTTVESAETSAAPESPVTPHVRISGNIWRMNPGLVFLRTPIGLMTLSCKTCLRDLRGNPTVTLFVHGPRGAVHITPKGAGAPGRRYLWGPLEYAAPDKKDLVLWTPEGEQQFSVDSLAAKLASVPAGRSVTFEIGEAGRILGVHDLQFDLQVSQLPSHSSQTEMNLTGSVSKIKNGYVHVQTGLGTLPITAKTGLCQGKDRCRAKVGQDLRLWIHDTTVAIDLYTPGSSTPSTRLLSGKLAYANPDKNSLSIWTPDGEQSFPTNQARATLASLKEGAPIIVELDGEGAVQEIRKGN